MFFNTSFLDSLFGRILSSQILLNVLSIVRPIPFLFSNNTPLNQITFPHFKMKISLHPTGTHNINQAQQDLHSSTAACLLSHCVYCYNLQCTNIDDLLSKQPLNFSTRSVSLSFCLVLNEFVSCLVYVNFEKSV